MRHSFFRACGAVLAAAATSVMVAGTATAASSSSSSSTKLQSATLNGDGATFPLGFYQVAIGAFKQQQHAVTINYQGVGSGQGRTDFANKVTDFGASDAVYKAGTAPTTPFFYFPTVVAPITVSYNLEGVKGLKLSADTVAKIFQAQITNWNDAAIKAENPNLKLPDQTITVVHRSDGSGTTENFTGWLVKAAPGTWTLGTGSTVQWPASTQGAQGNPGVGGLIQETTGAIGYVDLSDANALDLTFASVKNASGKYIAPTLDAASAALQGLTVNPDLTYDPLNAPGAKAYPITAPTWLLVYQTQTDAKKGAAVRAFLNFIYGTGSGQGQDLAASVDYAKLPSSLLKQAKSQVNKIVVPAT
jgi:phosphate transport system substrate-binding protein